MSYNSNSILKSVCIPNNANPLFGNDSSNSLDYFIIRKLKHFVKKIIFTCTVPMLTSVSTSS